MATHARSRNSVSNTMRALGLVGGVVLSLGCSGSAESAEEADEGALSGTVECPVGAADDRCVTKVHCTNPVEGKNEFTVPGKLTAEQLKAKCPNDVEPESDEYFDKERACPGAPATLDALGASVISPGGTVALLGAYTTHVRVRHVAADGSTSPWTKPKMGRLFIQGPGSLLLGATGNVVLHHGLERNPLNADLETRFRVYLDSTGADYRNVAYEPDGLKPSCNIEGRCSILFPSVDEAPDGGSFTPEIKVTADRCTWLGGITPAPRGSAGIQIQSAITTKK